jgi:hypothetical protein
MINNPRLLQLGLLTLVISGCTALGISRFDARYGRAAPVDRMVAPDSGPGRVFREQVQPILESRCVSCHACYEAPCQLNLNSPAGIDRGLTQTPVYNAARLLAAKPSRLFIDAHSTAAWRVDGFSPVLNERAQTPLANRAGSLLYQTLALKADNPLPAEPVLSDKDFTLSSNRVNACPTVESYAAFSEENPLAGMPYGLPGLTGTEFAVLADWLDGGAQMANRPPLAPGIAAQVQAWEAFLNADDLKMQLVARYIYEHLFLGSLYFAPAGSTAAPSEIFRLVRSRTPPGEPLQVIGTRRPNSNPTVARVYYRLQRSEAGVVTKTYLPYRLGPDRMAWLRELFLTPDYTVTELPGYEETFINPFVTFQAIPSQARYRFMLEDAKYIIEGFIKGPVCRGQVAVDVINDQFWVFFVDPEAAVLPMLNGFMDTESRNLQLPGNDGSSAGLLRHWQRYAKLNETYVRNKRARLSEVFADNVPLDTKLVWDGDGANPNAALTVFRHFDNAAVVQGLVGQTPKTAWIIDYPLLERIHYLLTVDFDVYGNVGHQLNTRLYMDFLRIEGEYNFLALLPQAERLRLRDYWYRDIGKRVSKYLDVYGSYIAEEPDIAYTTDDPKTELLDLLARRIGPALNPEFNLAAAPVTQTERQLLESLEAIRGLPVNLLPEMLLLRVTAADGSSRLFTLLSNRAHNNITSLFFEQFNRLPEEDSLTVANGVVGDYPNVLLQVAATELEDFAGALRRLATPADYAALLDAYGVRRTDPGFWRQSDAVHADYRRQQPLLAGWLDYSLLENR